MAKYDREFLVPYLQDICAYYLADRKLNQKINYEESRIKHYQEMRYIPKPETPHYEDSSIGCFGLFALFFAFIGLFLLIIPIIGHLKVPFWGYVLGLFALVSGGYVFLLAFSSSKYTESCNEEKRRQYDDDMSNYIRNVRSAEEEREYKLTFIPEIRKEIVQITEERNEARHLLSLAYSANIIPNQYRNIYAAVFLYDWFSTSGANDLDMALNMFVLEEIKSKLDRIIEHQAEIILNQRIMISNQGRMIDNQHQSMEMQREHRRMMQKKLDRIQATEEERLRYEKMVESNTAATAYFAWANYLK